jgi:hypothetical protein
MKWKALSADDTSLTLKKNAELEDSWRAHARVIPVHSRVTTMPIALSLSMPSLNTLFFMALQSKAGLGSLVLRFPDHEQLHTETH